MNWPWKRKKVVSEPAPSPKPEPVLEPVNTGVYQERIFAQAKPLGPPVEEGKPCTSGPTYQRTPGRLIERDPTLIPVVTINRAGLLENGKLVGPKPGEGIREALAVWRERQSRAALA